MRDLHHESAHPIVGDINETLHANEKEWGPARSQKAMDEFREVIEDCSLRDLGCSSGSTLSWQRGRDASTCVQERLDRFLASSTWSLAFPHYKVSHFARHNSDHSLIFLQKYSSPPCSSRRPWKPFIFEPLWLTHGECNDIVAASWRHGPGDPSYKIKSCVESLYSWSRKVFKDRAGKIENLETELKFVHSQHPNLLPLRGM